MDSKRDELWKVIRTLSEIRAGFDCSNRSDVEKYYSCSVAMDVLRDVAAKIFDEVKLWDCYLVWVCLAQRLVLMR